MHCGLAGSRKRAAELVEAALRAVSEALHEQLPTSQIRSGLQSARSMLATTAMDLAHIPALGDVAGE